MGLQSYLYFVVFQRLLKLNFQFLLNSSSIAQVILVKLFVLRFSIV